MENPGYQSLVNSPPVQLHSPLRPVTEETPVPATRTLSSVTVFPAEPAPFSFSVKNRALLACYLRNIDHQKKVGVCPKPFHCSPPSTNHSEGARTSLSPQG